MAQATLLDTTFNPGTGAQGGFVESMVIQPDGKILICGNFQSFNGQAQSYIARLHATGAVDTNFTANVSYWVRHMALQNDGKIVIGGFFTSVGGQSRNLVARLNSNGTLDAAFNPGTGGTGILGAGIDGNANPFVFATAIQPDGKIIIGGNFATYNGANRRGIARLETNGIVDTSFAVGSGVNSWVRSLLILTNSQIMVSGWFTSYNNQSFNRMVRLNDNGSADTNFNAYFGDQTAAYTMASLPNGQFIVGGHTVNSNSVFRQEIVRLNTNGTYDSVFNAGGTGANEKVQSVVLQPDGKIMMGGNFNVYNGVGVKSVARLNADGSLDNTFRAVVDNWIWTVVLQRDGKALICGGFSKVDGSPRSGIARLLSGPGPLVFNPRLFGDAFSVSVMTQNGKDYLLQYKNLLTETNWISLPETAGDGTVKILSDSNPSVLKRFYRVVEDDSE